MKKTMSTMKQPMLPETVVRLAPDEPFRFSCHPGVACFTECCRMLELPLSPYDVLRLRRGTGLTSSQLHERYIIEEYEEGDLFPRYYLTMIDDGRASCAFIGKNGCQVYDHRPGACRAYPLGRAAASDLLGRIREHFVLVREEHCRGFAESPEQDAATYMKEQGLVEYNTFNDALATLLHHPSIGQGRFTPTHEQRRLFTLVLYDIDLFRAQLEHGALDIPGCAANIYSDDEKLLLFGIDWLKRTFFHGG